MTPGSDHLHHFEIRSSVQVPREALREAYEASRAAYTQKLARFAKCTPSDAAKAVAAAHPGMKVETVQLRNIRTNLVYVAIAEDDEDRYLVIVDAGNGKILLDRPIPTHHERVFAD
ncbi:PepSY domain-containing protein [Alicyclobacillus cellulosilyticus]|uniref:PepSY domain-containing protein n=1 Tax=Alicyclobacillus cellulosilyticus TaxID=1003997 RepID=UPI001E46EED7|nr:PepSY domain-containing protein [Alicyclobacillus cellulosilyticus]